MILENICVFAKSVILDNKTIDIKVHLYPNNCALHCLTAKRALQYQHYTIWFYIIMSKIYM